MMLNTDLFVKGFWKNDIAYRLNLQNTVSLTQFFTFHTHFKTY